MLNKLELRNVIIVSIISKPDMNRQIRLNLLMADLELKK